MSAWIVSKKHVDVVVSEVFRQGGYTHNGTWVPVTTLEDTIKLGRMLWSENHKSTNYRYGEKRRTPVYMFNLVYSTPGVVACLTASYEYQTCEHPTYGRSKAQSVVNSIARGLLSSVEGYETAPWRI